jgi:hypothetical protein
VGPYDFRSLLFQYTTDVKNLLAPLPKMEEGCQTSSDRNDHFK